MAAADLPGTDEERAEAALIAAAGKILRSDNREVPEDFVAALFAHAVPEDLLRYEPRQLAELAADAWSLLAVRKPGVPKILLNAPDLAGHERLRADSVLEIVNDDMPFLVDSVLAELAERGLDVRFVVHPVLTVVRDDAGRLIAVKDARTAPGTCGERGNPHPSGPHRGRGPPCRHRSGTRAGARRHPPLRRRLAGD